MASVSQLGYLGLRVSDISAWERFTTEVLGLAVSERSKDGSLKLRMDDYHYRFVVQPNGGDDLAFIGWEVPHRETLEAVAEQLKTAGATVSRADAAEARARNVVEMFKFRDPSGIACELFYGPRMDAEPFVSPRPITGFKTGTMGLGHVVIAVDDFDKSLNFYTRALGMRISDFISHAEGPFRGLHLGFMHCNPRHHTLAIFANPGTKRRINHFMLELKSLDDVGATFDLCQQKGLPVATTMGRHPNDRMLSF